MSDFENPSRRIAGYVKFDTLGSDYVRAKSIRYETTVNADEFRLLPGCAACGSVEIVLYGELQKNMCGRKVWVRFDAGNTTGRSFGTFYVTDQSGVPGSGITTIHASDVMQMLDKENYVSKLLFPNNVAGILGEISQQFGVAIFWKTPGNMYFNMPTIPVKEKPVGYTCREIISYIAGMTGTFAIDAYQVDDSTPYAIVLKDYTDLDYTITPAMTFKDGLELRTRATKTDTPKLYTEFAVNPGGGAGPSPDDIRYLQNPDDINGTDLDVGSIQGSYAPYWMVYKNTKDGLDIEAEDGAPSYFVNFFTKPVVYYWYIFENPYVGGTVHNWTTDNGSRCTGTLKNYTADAKCYDWLEWDINDMYDLSYCPTSTEPNAYPQHKWFELVAANFDVYDPDGNLLFAANGDMVGSLRGNGGGGTGTGNGSIVYGSGDYTNPLIDADNLEVCQGLQSSHTYRPGSIKWRGNPDVRPGTAIAILSKDGDLIPFLVCGLSFNYDGGFYSEIHCHGSDETFDKTPGIKRDVKRIRGMREVWKT